MSSDLQHRFERMLDLSRDTGEGGREVLETGYHTLAAGREMLRWPDVGLEDLFAHALKEGREMFNDPKIRWGKTGPRETKDMIGQTTIGPWQITIGNVQNDYGLPYGMGPTWKTGDVFDYCQANPAVQAGMICDYIQRSYSNLGKRGPYAIQRYFWLEAYAKSEIGQGVWDKSVLPNPPDGDWKKLTPAMKADTGFYAKQILLGTSYNNRGLLYWLWATGDIEALKGVLDTWKNQKHGVWNAKRELVDLGEENGGFAIREEDLKYVPDESCKAAILAALK